MFICCVFFFQAEIAGQEECQELKSRISLYFTTSCHAGRLLTKLWKRSEICLGMKSTLRGAVQQPGRAGQGGREDHPTRAGMSEGQHASSLGRLGHELRSPYGLASGCECGCHPVEIKSEGFEEALGRRFCLVPNGGINLCSFLFC